MSLKQAGAEAASQAQYKEEKKKKKKIKSGIDAACQENQVSKGEEEKQF